MIQSLVDKFLNKGTLESDERKPNEKLNLQAIRLINSSTYWSTENLVVFVFPFSGILFLRRDGKVAE